MSDAVNHPSYYGGKIEVIDFIEDKELGFHLGNAVKYIARAGRKDPSKTVEDLKKAVWYVERYIELLSPEKCDDSTNRERLTRDVLKRYLDPCSAERILEGSMTMWERDTQED